jgi:hypothetical protein
MRRRHGVLHLPRAARSDYHNVAGGAACRALWISVGDYPSRAAHTGASVIWARWRSKKLCIHVNRDQRARIQFTQQGAGRTSARILLEAAGTGSRHSVGFLPPTLTGTKQPPRSRSRSIPFCELNNMNPACHRQQHRHIHWTLQRCPPKLTRYAQRDVPPLRAEALARSLPPSVHGVGMHGVGRTSKLPVSVISLHLTLSLCPHGSSRLIHKRAISNILTIYNPSIFCLYKVQLTVFSLVKD